MADVPAPIEARGWAAVAAIDRIRAAVVNNPDSPAVEEARQDAIREAEWVLAQVKEWRQ